MKNDVGFRSVGVVVVMVGCLLVGGLLLGWEVILGSAVGDIVGVTVHRQVVEQSQQYAETNTAAFYTHLEGVKKIDVQLAGLPDGDPQAAPLREQKDFLEGECRRAVAKIPADARTVDMLPYGGAR